jgi:Ca2+-binding EF-hand superfamily protein
MPAGEFYKMYSKFSSSSIRILQFAFRVILAEESSAAATRGALIQSEVTSFLSEFFQEHQDYVQAAWQAAPLPVARGYLDLHEWITLIFHLREDSNDEAFANKCLPLILHGARELQHRRTEVPLGEPVLSNYQLRMAKWQAEKEEAKNVAIRINSIIGLRPYYEEMFQKYEEYWNTTALDCRISPGGGDNNHSKKHHPHHGGGKHHPHQGGGKHHPHHGDGKHHSHHHGGGKHHSHHHGGGKQKTPDVVEPLLDHKTVLRVLDQYFWQYSTQLDEELERLVELRTANRKAESKAIDKFANEFSQEELMTFVRQFRDMDNDDGGTIDTEEIGRAFAVAGIDIDQETLLEVISEADKDKSGEVDIFEWIGMQKAVRDGTSKAMKLLAEAARKNANSKEAERQAQQQKRANASAQRSAILKKFPPQRLAMFQKTFNDFDEDGSGQVSLDEINAMCKAMDMNVNTRILKKLMDEVDSDGSGEIDFVEFVEMMDRGRAGELSSVFYQLAHKHSMMVESKRAEVMKKRQLEIKKRVKENEKRSMKITMRAEAKKKLSKIELAAAKAAFDTIDVDESGSLDDEELKEAFVAIGVKMTAKEVRKMRKNIDIDNDGVLDKDEFIIAIARLKYSAKHGRAIQMLSEMSSKLSKNADARMHLQKMKQQKLEARQREIQAAADRASMRAATRKKFPKAQLARLRVQFDVIDADSSGTLDHGEIMDLFAAMGDIKVTKKNIRKLMKEIDEDASGECDFDEFLLLYNKIQSSQTGFLAEARKRLERAKTSGDGGMGVDLTAMQEKADERKRQRTEQIEQNNKKAAEKVALMKTFSKRELEHLQELFDRLDSDRSGAIDREEMVTGLLEGDIRLTEEELDAALADIDEDGDGSLDWIEFVSMCQALQEGKDSTGGRLIMSLAEKKLKSAAVRRKQVQDEFLDTRKKMQTSLVAKEVRAEENRTKYLTTQSKARETKAVSRKERQEAARRRREAQ